jgi:hypothetical protein
MRRCFAIAPLLVLCAAPPAAAGSTDVRVNVPGQGEALPNCNIQSEVDVVHTGRTVVAGWNDYGRCDELLTTGSFSFSGYGWSDDGGWTWHDAGTLPLGGATAILGDPVLAAGPSGEIHYATLATMPNGHSIVAVLTSTDGGRTFGPVVDASPGAPGEQDKEWIAADTTSSPHRGNVYVAWTNGSSTMLFSRSTDGAGTFSAPVTLSASGDGGIGAQVAVGADGEVYVAWLSSDRRVWFTRSNDGGTSFAPPAPIASLEAIGHKQWCTVPDIVRGSVRIRDVLNGDIRVREWPSLAVDTSGGPHRGRVFVAVPSRGAGPDESDVFLMSSSDAGATWTAPRRINDDVTSADNFHPQVAVDDHGVLAVSWYDRRLSDPVPNWWIDVFAAVSTDGGETFAGNVRVGDVSFAPGVTNPHPGIANSCYMGEYMGLTQAPGGGFAIAWGDNRDSTFGLPDPNVYADVLPSP